MENAIIYIRRTLMPSVAATVLSWLTARNALPILVLYMNRYSTKAEATEIISEMNLGTEINSPAYLKTQLSTGMLLAVGPAIMSTRFVKNKERPKVA